MPVMLKVMLESAGTSVLVDFPPVGLYCLCGWGAFGGFYMVMLQSSSRSAAVPCASSLIGAEVALV